MTFLLMSDYILGNLVGGGRDKWGRGGGRQWGGGGGGGDKWGEGGGGDSRRGRGDKGVVVPSLSLCDAPTGQPSSASAASSHRGASQTTAMTSRLSLEEGWARGQRSGLDLSCWCCHGDEHAQQTCGPFPPPVLQVLPSLHKHAIGGLGSRYRTVGGAENHAHSLNTPIPGSQWRQREPLGVPCTSSRAGPAADTPLWR